MNDGHASFAPAPAGTLPDFPVSVGAVAAADFDHDGHLDLFVGGRVTPGFYPESPPSGLWLNRDGRFVDATAEIAPELKNIGMVTSALWSDVDGDGWVDLIVTLDWGGVRAFRNEQGRKLTDYSEKWGFTSGGTGWWTSIAAADFNHDGRIDYVVGNLGENTPFHATAAHPELLFNGDFAGNGQQQIIEAYYVR